MEKTMAKHFSYSKLKGLISTQRRQNLGIYIHLANTDMSFIKNPLERIDNSLTINTIIKNGRVQKRLIE
ncbi:hypothetical protein QQ020_01925 [Fulvivirgaceae bacterium BMA12]|uniref:Transposase n=1 Tax=Agaribacillus aureus TaxID=3051825 RepID=A0ABT8KZB9_9BACT|nr:hypothetical protein [Fulvivirgaceae bacterium BMA12]